MKILSKVTWKAMWKNRTRTIVTIVGVILSSAMFMAVVTLGFSFLELMIDSTKYDEGDWHILYDRCSDEEKSALLADKRFSQLADLQLLGYGDPGYDSEYKLIYRVAAADQTFFDTMPVHLTSGRLPQNSGEVILSREILDWMDMNHADASEGSSLNLHLSGESGGPEWEKTYTIVGIYETDYFSASDTAGSFALTFDDGKQGPAQWHRLFLKASDPADSLKLGELDYGNGGWNDIHTSLLRFYGITRYDNLRNMLVGICSVLMTIIMVGSISLIYNAFSISVAERTKQFGLLSSVGATRPQIRQSVFFEAGVISLIGIPVGLVCGYGGIWVVLRLTKDYFSGLVAGGTSGYVQIQAIAPPIGFLAAAATALLTVLISVWIPARRAMQITPIEAIRQARDYKATGKDVKVGKLTYRIFGLSGIIARKYFKISRKKYRTTIFSLAISVILFISVASFGTILRNQANGVIGAKDYDFMLYCGEDNWEKVVKDIRKIEGIDRSVYSAFTPNGSYHPMIPADDLSQEYKDATMEMWGNYLTTKDTLVEHPAVYYVEDAALEEFLIDQGLDPTPYLDEENPSVIILPFETTNGILDDDGNYIQKHYKVSVLDKDVETLTCYDLKVPKEYYPFQSDAKIQQGTSFDRTSEGELVISCYFVEMLEDTSGLSEDCSYVIRKSLAEDGTEYLSYHPYDIYQKTVAEEPAFTVPAKKISYRIGATLMDAAPLGVSRSNALTIILPFSALPEEESYQRVYFAIKSHDLEAVRNYLNREGIVYSDPAMSEENSRSTLILINVFSYGFITLISLICVANVFNTISTNIALRRKDFGMLRSVGMKDSEMYRMMNYECLIYGFRALLIGLPLGIGLSYLIFRLVGVGEFSTYQFPLAAVLIASGVVFLVVFITMLYATSKLKKDTPLEAIRAECT